MSKPIITTAFGVVRLGDAIHDEMVGRHGEGYMEAFLGLAPYQRRFKKNRGLVRDVESLQATIVGLAEWMWRLGYDIDCVFGQSRCGAEYTHWTHK